MKLKLACYIVVISICMFSCNTAKTIIPSEPAQSNSNFEKLATIKNSVSIEKKAPSSHFNENCDIWFEQPVDYNDSSKGTFRQRVFLGFERASLPVIVELKGYGIGSERAGELAAHYKANQISIEHRFFNNSRPKEIDRNTLTIENAAKNQTRIINAIRDVIFPNSKFITTGISKGCQNITAHRRFYTNDVDASVCYVGPLNYQREDPRVYQFLKSVATKGDRAKVKAFQNLCFENRATLLQLMTTETVNKKMTWEFGIEKAIDYSF